jgi:hypothetical protein
MSDLPLEPAMVDQFMFAKVMLLEALIKSIRSLFGLFCCVGAIFRTSKAAAVPCPMSHSSAVSSVRWLCSY